MKKPIVDYRKFRLSKRNDPAFAHLKYLWGWIVYLLLYVLTERLIPPEKCTVVRCRLDEMIPFCEGFVIFYVVWYGYIVFSLIYFALYDVDSFKKLCIYTTIVQLLATAIYILFPTQQNLRPEVFPRDNFLTDCVAWLYAVDTNTGVCPSLHVAISIAIAAVWLRKRDVSRLWKTVIAAVAVLICLSIFFIKQHSVIDAVAAVPLCLTAELYLHWKDRRWRPFCLRELS